MLNQALVRFVIGLVFFLACVFTSGSAYAFNDEWDCVRVNQLAPYRGMSFSYVRGAVNLPGGPFGIPSPLNRGYIGIGNIQGNAGGNAVAEYMDNFRFKITVNGTGSSSGSLYVQCSVEIAPNTWENQVWGSPVPVRVIGDILSDQNIRRLFINGGNGYSQKIYEAETNNNTAPSSVTHAVKNYEVQFDSSSNIINVPVQPDINTTVPLISGPESCFNTSSGSPCNVSPREIKSPRQPEETNGLAVTPQQGSKTDSCSKTDPCDLFNGNYYYQEADLKIAGIMPIGLVRNYYSSKSDLMGEFGVGTTLSTYNYSLLLYTDAYNHVNLDAGAFVELNVGNGSTIRFYNPNPGGGNVFRNYGKIGVGGDTVKLSTDSNDYLTGAVYTTKNQDVFTFDANARLVSIADRYGNQVALTRDPDGKLTKITEPTANRFIELTYNTDGLISQAEDHTGRIFQYGYSTDKELISVTDALNHAKTYSWDSAHRIISGTDYNGITKMTNVYGPTGAVIEQTQADNAVIKMEAFTTRVRKVIDDNNHETFVNYNVSGYVNQVQDALGHNNWTDYSFDFFDESNTGNRYIDSQNSLNFVTRTTFNADKLPIKISDPANNETEIEYDLVHVDKPKKITDPLGHQTQFTYDTLGSLTQITDNAANVTGMTYNGKGQVLTVTDALNQVTSFGYNASNDLSSVTDPLNRTTRYDYDLLGRVRKMTDAKNNETALTYDALDRLTQTENALNQSQTYTYDNNGNLTSLINGRGKTTAYGYDAKDRLISVTNPNNEVVSYTYDGADNLLSITDGKGQVTSNTYDAANRLTVQDFNGVKQYVYVYDVGNRLTNISDGSNNWGLGYNSRSLMTSTTSPTGNVGYAYNDNNLLSQLSSSGYGTVEYTYDLLDRLSELEKGGNVYSYTYDPLSRRTSLSRPNGIVTAYEYDLASQLKALTQTKNTQALERHAYAYDATGNITEYRRGKGSMNALVTIPAGNGQEIKEVTGYVSVQDEEIIRTYVLDALDRISSVEGLGWIPRASSFANPTDKASALSFIQQAKGSSGMSRENLLQQAEALGAVIAESASWSFDQNGNMASKQWRLPGGNSASKTFSYNDSDRATQITQTGITPSAITMNYDANGNLTGDSLQRVFTWNVLDQLTNFTRPTVSASFSYDPLGRRTSLINGSTNKSYLYDGQNMLKDGIADFLNGANIDEPLEYESSSHSWNYFQDHLGSSTQLRNTGDGASVQRYDYKSYGKLEGNLSNTTSTTTALTYTGREDDNTGLYYYRNRYYDPNLELFISEDPLGDAQRYVGGNPLSYTDPLGLERFQNPNCLLGSAYDDAGNYVGCKENSLLPSFILDWPFNGGVRSAASFIPCPNPVIRYSDSTRRAFENQLQKYGKNSLIKSKLSLQRQLDRHVFKIKSAQKNNGYTSSMEREIRGFQQQIDAINDILKP